MSLGVKRLLIVFSVALNIGFAIIAVRGMLAPEPPQGRFMRNLMAVQHSLDKMHLPEDKQRQAVAAFASFSDEVTRVKAEIRRLGRENLMMLAMVEGPDQEAFDGNVAVICADKLKLEQLVIAHFLEMRRIMGPQYSPQFFGEILAHAGQDQARKE